MSSIDFKKKMKRKVLLNDALNFNYGYMVADMIIKKKQVNDQKKQTASAFQ